MNLRDLPSNHHNTPELKEVLLQRERNSVHTSKHTCVAVRKHSAMNPKEKWPRSALRERAWLLER